MNRRPARVHFLVAAHDPHKILIVDDDADWREFVRVTLTELGYQALEAADGETALELLEQARPAVMLLDLHMPGMNGEDVLAALPSPAPRVVVLTSAPAQEAAGALGAGAHYYLPKGASREQLEMMLQSLALH